MKTRHLHNNDRLDLVLEDWMRREYVEGSDPIKYYFYPIIGQFFKKRVRMCLEQCKGGQSILEVGFGMGLSFTPLSHLYQEIYGIDLMSPIKIIEQHFQDQGLKVNLQNGNLLDLPYADGSFDAVLLISILEHLKPAELETAYEEIRRVLKPEGQVVFGVPVERGLMVILFRMLGEDIRQNHFSTEKEISDMAEKWFTKVSLTFLQVPFFGSIYEAGNFVKSYEKDGVRV
jgi:ubiquinone/menaquinone biosynthesis C-methylase UbiE